jgi:hypothetical protein
MCPVCVSVIAVAVAAATPSGVVDAFREKISARREAREFSRITLLRRESRHGHQSDRASESRLAS